MKMSEALEIFVKQQLDGPKVSVAEQEKRSMKIALWRVKDILAMIKFISLKYGKSGA